MGHLAIFWIWHGFCIKSQPTQKGEEPFYDTGLADKIILQLASYAVEDQK